MTQIIRKTGKGLFVASIILLMGFSFAILGGGQIGDIVTATFFNPSTADLDMANFDIMMGTGQVGYDGAANEGWTFDTSGNITMGSAGAYLDINNNNILLGTGGIGNDNPIITFAAGAAGASTFAGDINLAGADLLLNVDTLIHESAADVVDIEVGGTLALRITESGDDIVISYPVVVDSVTVADGGTGYADSGSLVITDEGTGSGMSGTFTAIAGVIQSPIVIVTRGSGYTYAPTIDGDAGGNGDAVLTPVMRTNVLSLSRGSAVAPAVGWGNTGFRESAVDTINFTFGGVDKMVFSASLLGWIASGGGRLRNTTSSVLPFVFANGDSDLGLGRAAADQLSHIAGGVEGVRITEDTNKLETWIKGSQKVKVTPITGATYTVLQTDFYLQVTYTGTGVVTITMPAISTVTDGFILHIKDSGYNANNFNITVARNGSDTINNVGGNYTMNVAGMNLTLIANDTTDDWEIM